MDDGSGPAECLARVGSGRWRSDRKPTSGIGAKRGARGVFYDLSEFLAQAIVHEVKLVTFNGPVEVAFGQPV